MAFQLGAIKLKGTIGDITYYYSNGKYLCRRRTSLNKERIMQDPSFAKTRKFLPVFASASRLASIVHKQLSQAQKRKVRNSKLIKEILPLLRKKIGAKKIIRLLQQRYGIIIKGMKKLKFFISNVRIANLYFNTIGLAQNLGKLLPAISPYCNTATHTTTVESSHRSPLQACIFQPLHVQYSWLITDHDKVQENELVVKDHSYLTHLNAA